MPGRFIDCVPGTDEAPLLSALSAWGHNRARWIHEFAKVSNKDNLDWDERLDEARRVAHEGLELLQSLTNESRLIRRVAGLGSGTGGGLPE